MSCSVAIMVVEPQVRGQNSSRMDMSKVVGVTASSLEEVERGIREVNELKALTTFLWVTITPCL